MTVIKPRFKVITSIIVALIIALTSSISTTFAAQPHPERPLDKNNLEKLTVDDAKRIKDGVKFDLGKYDGYIHFLSEDMIKVSIIPDGSAEKDSSAIAKKDWETPRFSAKEKQDHYTLKTKKITVEVNEKTFGVKILDKQGNVINEDEALNGSSSGYENGKPYVIKKTDPSENFYGFGEQTGSQLNKRGKSLANFNSDSYGYNNSTKYVYTAIPFFIGLKAGNAYGILFDNSYRTYYNMAKDSDDYYYFYADGGPLTYYFMNGPDISHVLDQYTELTGKIKLPPEWALGLQQSAWAYTPEQIENIAQTYRDKKIPLDTMNFDIDYMNGYRVFTWSDAYKKAFDTIKSIPGMHAVTINDPGVKKDDQFSVFNEGIAKDYFVKKADGTPYIGPVWAGDSGFPNFVNSQVRNWWSSNIASTLLNAGVDGIWNDMNEPAVFNDDQGLFHTLPLDSYGIDDEGNKVLHEQFHNEYGHLEDEATYNAWAAANSNKRPFVLTRDMFAGTQRYAAVWTGDSLSDWEHLQMSMPMNMNIGLSGQAFVGNDIGGFGNQATPELFARWIELGSFLPFSRIHYDQWSDRNYHQEPWSFGSDVEKISKKYIELRYQLLPYLYNAFNDASKTGKPVQQPLVYQFQKDPGTYNIDDESMFGDSLLLAPVVEQGKTSRSVYLPKGETWINYWDQKEYQGGQTITVDAPLDSMPIFVKKDSIIPTREVQQYTQQNKLTNLTLDTYLDHQASYSFYEDDGKTLDHDKGQYNITDFQVKKDGNAITFDADKKVSNYDSALQSYTLKIHEAKDPKHVVGGFQKYDRVSSLNELDNQKNGYYFDSNASILYVKVPVDHASKVIIH
ncbi:glycoside hydrolase family 31 protein [Sporolactobacillus laevolacticus]|uniref:Alpha-glucosidase n=1 Tax=Sporolactobacillus laevolacticus DSM 442 TaxID=1395513 RepID=V6J2N8_9BACL|nr:glycoside hydrolase family 31 protein [Sporolactobacillus laevolacticus]EST11024.1 alpha-glucosidase [Sporolactobacillus laevolacticus DSM 442]